MRKSTKIMRRGKTVTLKTHTVSATLKFNSAFVANHFVEEVKEASFLRVQCFDPIDGPRHVWNL
jgi:hypothetical protein